jgi:hypothetical protein
MPNVQFDSHAHTSACLAAKVASDHSGGIIPTRLEVPCLFHWAKLGTSSKTLWISNTFPATGPKDDDPALTRAHYRGVEKVTPVR